MSNMGLDPVNLLARANIALDPAIVNLALDQVSPLAMDNIDLAQVNLPAMVNKGLA